MMRRRAIGRVGRPGVVGTVARTAVVAGTATAVSNRVSRRQDNRAQQAADAQAYNEQQQMAAGYGQPAYGQPAYQAPPPPPPPPPAAADPISQLKDLADLRQQGILTDAEFEAQKARILGT